jgi:hypothetical protein
MDDTTAEAPLTRRDRCDRCGAAAVLRAVLRSGGLLLFCGHHAREHGPRLRELRARTSVEVTESHSWVPPHTPADPAAGALRAG